MSSPTQSTPPQHASLRDANEDLGLNPVRPADALRMVGRALRLRCPACGGGPVLQHWLKMRPTCGACAIPLERGEQDYFIGSMMWNLVLSEFLFIAVFISVLVWQWPMVNWDVIQWAAPLGMAVVPFLLFPVSKLIWLAFDLILRPERQPQPTPRPPQ